MNNCNVSDKKCAPWYDNISDTLRTAKISHCKAEIHWRSSGLTVDKEIYDSTKKAVTTIVHKTKCVYYSAKIAESSNTTQHFSITDKLMAKHSRTPLPAKHLNELLELFSNFSGIRFKQLEIIFMNVCRWLVRTHHKPTTTNSLFVHLIVSLQSWKIPYEKLYFRMLLRLVN